MILVAPLKLFLTIFKDSLLFVNEIDSMGFAPRCVWL
jgi:hypothetical protein